MMEPKIRFKGFEGEWKTSTIGEIAPLSGGYAFQSNHFSSVGIPIVRISNILETGIVGGVLQNTPHLMVMQIFDFMMVML